MKNNIHTLLLLIAFVLFYSCSDSNDQVAPDDQEEQREEEEEEEVIVYEDPGKSASDCYPAFEEDELNVVTWNIEFFPMNGNTTLARVQSLIEDLDADIIAVQEIAEPDDFLELGNAIPGWKAVYSNVRYGQELGYLYKQGAFSAFGELEQLFDNDASAFPRQAVKVDVTHISGLELSLINIHLKCCGEDGSDEQDRRASASTQLEAYIETNLDDKTVIVLGDFNDEITGTTPFQNFIDNANFTFADQSIAEDQNAYWSYPSWPSHIDHILISNELFTMVRNVQTINPDACVQSYSTVVSDHRPVLASFK